MKVRIATHTDKGPRDNLEDAVGAFSVVQYEHDADEAHILDTFDGVGGETYGEVASSIARSVSETSLVAAIALAGGPMSAEPVAVVQDVLKSVLVQANDAILRQADEDRRLLGMSTTAVIALIVGEFLHVAWVGDSRCYWVGRRRILQVTRDHTEINRLIEAGLLSRDDAVDHPMAHAINRFLGQPTDFSPETDSCQLTPGDMVVVCTDGLTDVVADHEILELVNRSREGHIHFADLPKRLVGLALSKGTGDNCTVLCCECVPERHLTTNLSGRTLTGAYPLQVAHVLRNLKEIGNEYPNGKTTGKTERRTFARADR